MEPLLSVCSTRLALDLCVLERYRLILLDGLLLSPEHLLDGSVGHINDGSKEAHSYVALLSALEQTLSGSSEATGSELTIEEGNKSEDVPQVVVTKAGVTAY